MIRYVFAALPALTIPVAAQSFLEEEDYFFDIPGLESLSTGWFLTQTDSCTMGFRYPVDVELLKLAPTDYRLVVLDAYSPNFFVFRIDQQFGLSYVNIDTSGTAPDACAYAIAMCLMQHDTLFNPPTDRLAVVFHYGATIGIYRFDV